MKSRWPDFLFTIAVRSLCGMVVGLLISVPLIFFGKRKSPLVELIQAHRYEVLIGWFALWGLGGAIIGIWTTPHWQRPWFKYKKWGDKDNDDIHVV
jgi:hypothetical protein